MRLNIACGPNMFPHPGWINYDREDMIPYLQDMKRYLALPPDQWDMPDHQQRLIRYLGEGGPLEFKVRDLKAGFPEHPTGSVEGIYLGQMIEHLNPVYEAPQFIHECWRMLKTGGVLRITTPDLQVLLDAYAKNEMEKFSEEQPGFYRIADPAMQLAYIMFGATGPNCTWNNYEGHMCLYTPSSLELTLRRSGFPPPAFLYRSANKSQDIVMEKQVVDFGLSHSFVLEVVKQ